MPIRRRYPDTATFEDMFALAKSQGLVRIGYAPPVYRLLYLLGFDGERMLYVDANKGDSVKHQTCNFRVIENENGQREELRSYLKSVKPFSVWSDLESCVVIERDAGIGMHHEVLPDDPLYFLGNADLFNFVLAERKKATIDRELVSRVVMRIMDAYMLDIATYPSKIEQ